MHYLIFIQISNKRDWKFILIRLFNNRKSHLLLVPEMRSIINFILEIFLYGGIFRSSRPERFCRKGVLRNFAKFTGKQLCQSLFFNKVAGCLSLQLYEKRNPGILAKSSILNRYLIGFWICLFVPSIFLCVLLHSRLVKYL